MNRPDFSEISKFDAFKDIEDFYDSILSVYDENDFGFPFPICSPIEFNEQYLFITCTDYLGDYDKSGSMHRIAFYYDEDIKYIVNPNIIIIKPLFVDNQILGIIDFNSLTENKVSSINEKSGKKLAKGIMSAVNFAKEGIAKEIIDSIVSFFVNLNREPILSASIRNSKLSIRAYSKNDLKILINWNPSNFNQTMLITIGTSQIEAKTSPKLLSILRSDYALSILEQMKKQFER